MAFIDIQLSAIILLLTFSTGVCIIDREKDLTFDSFPSQNLILPLDNDAQQKSVLVEGSFECIFSCISEKWCRSINYKKEPQKGGLIHVCELISIDQYNNTKYMVKDDGFNHYSVQVRLTVQGTII